MRLPNADAIIGTTWQVITNLLQGEDPPIPVKAIQPDGGRDRLVGHLDDQLPDAAPRTAPTCGSTASPRRRCNAEVAEWFGEAPANSKACTVSDAAQANCDVFHAADVDFWETVWYWQTPETTCVDGRTDVICKGFDDWVNAWKEIKG